MGQGTIKLNYRPNFPPLRKSGSNSRRTTWYRVAGYISAPDYILLEGPSSSALRDTCF